MVASFGYPADEHGVRQEALERILHEVMIADKSLDDRIRTITEIAAGALGVDTCAVLQGRPASKILRRRDVFEARLRQHLSLPDISIDDLPGFQERMERDHFVCFNDCLDPLIPPALQDIFAARGFRSLLSAAAWYRDRSLGGITFSYRQPHHWRDAEILFATSASNLVALLFAMERSDTLLARLDQVPEGLYVEDDQGTITYANRAARKLTVGDDLDTLPRPALTADRDNDLTELNFAGKELEIYRARLPEGGLMTRISDVTERKAKLAEVSTMLRSIVDSTNDMIWCVDPSDFRLTMFNRGLAEYFAKFHHCTLRVGMKHEEILPTEHLRQTWREMYRRTLEMGSFFTEYEMAADKRTLLVRINCVKMGDKVCGLSVFGQDITAIKAIQDKLLKAQKLEAMGRTAAGVAHDFNNVLGAIGGFASLLVKDLAPSSRELVCAERILKCCDKGKELADQILTFARGADVQRAPLDLCTLVQHFREFGNDPMFANVAFTVDTPDGAVQVLGNQTQIGQLIGNLCLNARDAHRGSKVAVTISTIAVADDEVKQLARAELGPEEILIGAALPGRSYCCLRIADNGTGIPPDLLARIFEPFFTTKDRQHGTGLGLAVVHSVVQSHHAVCHVRSDVGHGTTFSIYFPREADMRTAATERAAGLRAERILVVDDDPDILDVLTIGLERQGFTVTGISDPLQALAAFVENPRAFDVVISDNVMPAMAGRELLRRLQEVNASVLTVLCSGAVDGDGGAQDADLVFSKSTHVGVIAAAIRSIGEAA